MNPKRFALIHLVAGLLLPVCADVTLPDVISDGMMLQADRSVRIWGWAAPGEPVTVFHRGQIRESRAGADGAWHVVLDPMPASSSPRTLVIHGSDSNQVTRIKNVLVGDVWLAGGQSNMAYPVKSCLHAAREIGAANHPEIRIFMARRILHDTPPKMTAGRWVVCSPDTVGEASGVAYFFVRELFRKTGRPQSFLNVNWSGTPIEAWMSRQVLESDPVFAASLDREWKQAHWLPSSCYRSMLAPLFPFTLRGILWYQGEGNAGRPEQYRALFLALIREWRSGFGERPFYFAQIATQGDAPVWFQSKGGWPLLREAQMLALTEPDTGMAVTHDLGIPGDVHYPDKQSVGHRLARIALEDLYRLDHHARSPRFEKAEFANGRAVISFRDAEQGLADAQPVEGFVIAGCDGKFLTAQARVIDGNRVAVWNDTVIEPMAVRYAWSAYPIATLADANGLPVAGFRTDGPAGTDGVR
ncbi:MAG: sialate O-acetylesterase [Verrucomicrobia bacterium]|nr:sialate O-acetylesterase [Kiritimatiellia bacterium]MCP5488139.1 sialate O-acetylesterase [Verrucomicrobiota bacterium]